jgi:LuxR family maltose regulon positive regulatory protein
MCRAHLVSGTRFSRHLNIFSTGNIMKILVSNKLTKGGGIMAYYPRLNSIYITERLKQRLYEINNYTITTVIAPMGFGKTTAVNWWAKRMVKGRSEAVVLRQMIVTNSVTDFWSGFCRAFKDYPELIEQMKALGFPKDATSMSLLSELLYDALSWSPCPIYFIMDDLHLLGKNTITSLILLLFRNLPDCVHFILLSRNQVFTEEERMRLGNLLCEIGQMISG